MVARFVTRDDDVLLVGSGPGRDLVALVGDGYRVMAVEPARRAIATSRRQLEMRGLSADIIEGFFEDVRAPPPLRRDHLLGLLLQLHPRIAPPDRGAPQGAAIISRRAAASSSTT